MTGGNGNMAQGKVHKKKKTTNVIFAWHFYEPLWTKNEKLSSWVPRWSSRVPKWLWVGKARDVCEEHFVFFVQLMQMLSIFFQCILEVLANCFNLALGKVGWVGEHRLFVTTWLIDVGAGGNTPPEWSAACFSLSFSFHLFSTCFVEIEDLFEILRRQCCQDTHCKIREIHLTVEAIPTQKRWFFTQCVKNYEADFSRVMMASLRWERRGIWKKQKKYFRPSR